MEVSEQVQIVSVERLKAGLVIKFMDGRCAFYSDSLLYALYDQADKLDETKIAW